MFRGLHSYFQIRNFNARLDRPKYFTASNLSAEKIQSQSWKTLKKLDQVPIRETLAPLTARDELSFMAAIKQNPVAGKQELYERTDTEIGYCFGRAVCMHIEAMKRGYKKSQIKKIWVVGDMLSGENHWAYHVATMIRNVDGKWQVLDNLYDAAVPPALWYKDWLETSTDGKLQVFVTDAEKFAPTAGKYSRLELGLDLDKKTDFYKGYFKDLMGSFRE